MVSNAIDATQKLKTLKERGDYKGELGDLTVHVSLDADKGTITISDRGIGMTEEEIDKYINQIAFSGVSDFLEKYKDNANNIIGHFGLGFYSSFMVSKKVEIITRSYKDDAKAVKWTCDGSPAYEIDEAEKADRGSDIVLYIDDDCKEFLEKYRIEQLLQKYCKFLAVPVAFGKKQEWKDGKQQDTDEDNIINNVEPLWTKQPSTLKDDDYLQFYHTLYPMQDDPMFWIHLNVDYPFNLTGILYFPRIKSNLDLQRNKIQLYCNQVFVTDQVEGIVPEFLTLLHGVIDSPDIPLNVSRSYLQGDPNVKKISSYITKKVSDRLSSIFKTQRTEYEEKWKDISIFIAYGMLSEPDFYDKAKDFFLLTDTEGKHFTLEEYRTLISAEQTNKDGNVVYLYATDKEAQYAQIEAAKKKGYSVLLMNGQLDAPLMNMLESKLEKSTFSRVDADVPERLVQKEEIKEQTEEEKKQYEGLVKIFSDSLKPAEEDKKAPTYNVQTQALGETSAPITLTQSEYMRRMKEMARLQPGIAFYGELPDSYNVILNTDAPIIKKIVAGDESQVSQLIDLCLLQNGLLKGEALQRFVERTMQSLV